MAVVFYMDQHVDLAITRGLRRRGIDVLRVQDDGHDRADDEVILEVPPEEKVEAEFRHGVLTVKLPKSEEIKPKHIEVKEVKEVKEA